MLAHANKHIRAMANIAKETVGLWTGTLILHVFPTESEHRFRALFDRPIRGYEKDLKLNAIPKKVEMSIKNHTKNVVAQHHTFFITQMNFKQHILFWSNLSNLH